MRDKTFRMYVCITKAATNFRINRPALQRGEDQQLGQNEFRAFLEISRNNRRRIDPHSQAVRGRPPLRKFVRGREPRSRLCIRAIQRPISSRRGDRADKFAERQRRAENTPQLVVRAQIAPYDRDLAVAALTVTSGRGFGA